MTYSTEILETATGVLLILLLRHSGSRPRLGKAEFWLLLAGFMLPTIDYWLPLVLATDRIEFLTRTRYAHGLYFGLVAMLSAGGGAMFLLGLRRALFGTLWAGAGFVAHVLIALVTPVGAPLWFPLAEGNWSLPLFAGGHPFLVLLAALALGLLVALPLRSRAILVVTWSLAGLYVLFSVALYPVMAARIAEWTPPGSRVQVEPGGPWPGQWRYTVVDDDHYLTGEADIVNGVTAYPERVDRWDNQPLLLSLLADPVVNRFYHRVFRHPVARLETSDAHSSLVLAEAHDVGMEGADTFLFEIDREEGTRLYQVEGFRY